jgi:hypothetical protein
MVIACLSSRRKGRSLALSRFLKMTPREWRLVRPFEEVIRLLLPFLPTPHNIRKEGQERESILVVEVLEYRGTGDSFSSLLDLLPSARNRSETRIF